MRSEEGKHLRLLGLLIAAFLGFIGLLILLFLFMRLVFGAFNQMPALNSVFLLFVIAVPSALFIPVFIIYWRKTRRHPSVAARIFSYLIFSIALAAWSFALVRDLMLFFEKHYPDAGRYFSYNLYFLAATVFSIFLTGIVQAFAMLDEIHWTEKVAKKS